MLNQFKVLPEKKPEFEVLSTLDSLPMKYAVVYENNVTGLFSCIYWAEQFIKKSPYTSKGWSIRELYVDTSETNQ